MGRPVLTNTLAITQDVWSEVVHCLDLAVESAGVMTARSTRHDGGVTLLARQLFWVPDDQYLIRASLRLSIASAGYVPALGAAAADGATAIFLHTHPGGNPAPSDYDDEVDRQIKDLFILRSHSPTYISLIVGGTSRAPRITGRIYGEGDRGPDPISRLRIVGDRIRILATEAGSSAEPNGAAIRHFDRQIRAFGKDGQDLLGRMKVGVVGAGGTGSAVFEQLVRLGVGDVVVVDDDVVDDSNLSRIHESAAADRGRPKVEVLAQRSAAMGLGSLVTPVQARLRTPAITRLLTDRDVVFGCTDDDFGRAVLSRLAYWYLIPVIDMGFVVDVQNGTVRDLFGRVTVVGPGTACLLCRRRVSAQRVAWESLGEDERRKRVHEGYVPDLGEPAPSVVAYTTMVAGLAVSEMLERLFGYGYGDPPSELLLRLAERSLSRNSLTPNPDHYCGDRSRWGSGDEPLMLGWVWPPD